MESTDRKFDPSELGQLLAGPCGALCRPGHKVIVVASEDKAVRAFDKLVEANVLSAPCRDEKGKLLGFLELRDLVSLICLSHVKPAEAKAGQGSQGRELYLQSLLSSPAVLEGVMAPGQCPRGVSCGSLAKGHPLVSCRPTDSIRKVFDLLGDLEIRRVPIVDDKGNILDIISESTMIAFLAKHVEDLPKTLAPTLQDVGTAPVIGAQHDNTALEALVRMDEKRISGIPILDDDGYLIGQLRASDLKLYLRTPVPCELDGPLVAFLQRLRKEDPHEHMKVVTGLETDSLATAVQKLAASGLHRLFVVSKAAAQEGQEGQVGLAGSVSPKVKPIRIISLTDILVKLQNPAVANRAA